MYGKGFFRKWKRKLNDWEGIGLGRMEAFARERGGGRENAC